MSARAESKAGEARPKVGFRSRRWEANRRPPPATQWVWLTREMLESPAWKAMSLPARRVVDRLILENMAHAGVENGNLKVSSIAFRAAGISGKHLASAIDEAEVLGFIAIVKRGRGGNAEFRRPSVYALSWLPTVNDDIPSNAWRRLKTKEEAVASKTRLKAERNTKKKTKPHGWPEAKPHG